MDIRFARQAEKNRKNTKKFSAKNLVFDLLTRFNVLKYTSGASRRGREHDAHGTRGEDRRDAENGEKAA